MARLRIDGRRVCWYASTRAEVAALLAGMHKTCARQPSVIVGELLKLWLSRTEVKLSTYVMYEWAASAWLCQPVAQELAADVTTSAISNALHNMTQKRSVGAMLIVLRMTYKFAQRNGICEANPAALVMRPRIPAFRATPPTLEQMHHFSSIARSRSRWWPIFALAA